ncbi:UNVERIFIED_CONTAM: stage II sporulation protein R [Acetivibrio alkalicellulosi]
MIKKFKTKLTKKTSLKAITLFLLSTIFIVGIVFASYSENVSNGLSDSLIRLHVVANSDSPEDQQLKNDVRDEIIKYMKDELKNIKDVDKTKEIINENLEYIRDIAKKEIDRQGKYYNVDVSLGNYPFPTKVYGDINLPAGVYQALRVSIGESTGKNWWCVLFPPLCFVDATHGTISDSVKEELREILTKEEYSLITAEEEEFNKIEISIKFKVVEVFQDTKIKASETYYDSKIKISRMFNKVTKALN